MPRIDIACAADAVRVYALPAQRHGLAVLVEIQLEARAVILEAVRRQLAEILPAAGIRHGDAAIAVQTILTCRGNAEPRGSIQRIEIDHFAVGQQDVLVRIAGHLRLAAHRDPVESVDTRLIPGDLAAQHGEDAEIPDTVFSAGDPSRVVAAAIQQRQGGTRVDRDRGDAGVGGDRLPVQAEGDIPSGDGPLFVKRDRAVKAVAAVSRDVGQRRHSRELHVAVHVRLALYDIPAARAVIAHPAVGPAQTGLAACVDAPRLRLAARFIAVIVEHDGQLAGTDIAAVHHADTLGGIRSGAFALIIAVRNAAVGALFKRDGMVVHPGAHMRAISCIEEAAVDGSVIQIDNAADTS